MKRKLLIFEELRIQEVFHPIFINFYEERIFLIFHLVAYHIVEFSFYSTCINTRLIYKTNTQTWMQTLLGMSYQIL